MGRNSWEKRDRKEKAAFHEGRREDLRKDAVSRQKKEDSN